MTMGGQRVFFVGCAAICTRVYVVRAAICTRVYVVRAGWGVSDCVVAWGDTC